MECNYELKDGCLRICVPKELDHHCAVGLRMEADLLIEAYQVRKLIFDFSETEFMDSSGIGVLIGRCKNMSYSGGEVTAENLSERVQKIFVVSGLHKIIKIETKEDN
ncbi:MAG: anti-sigma factor antagonist [Lachnospiraceae bacterium]|nr:anti-sigma factor antagonist [Lachnospiraceae bacterium]